MHAARVGKCYGAIQPWGGDLTIHIIDNSITVEVLQAHLDMAGLCVGIGRFSPGKGGTYGRFKASVKSFK